MDPLAEKYWSTTPYTYGLNNPIYFIDPDGKQIVDPKGNVVTFKVNNNGSLSWSANATENIKRLGNAMAKTSKGMERLNFLNNVNHKVYMNIDTTTKNGKWGYNSYSVSNWNEKTGEFDIKSTTITIYEAEIKDWVDSIKGGNVPIDEEGEKYAQLINDIDLIISAVTGHESGHSEKDNIRMQIQNNTQDQNNDVELKPIKIENEILDELIKNKDEINK